MDKSKVYKKVWAKSKRGKRRYAVRNDCGYFTLTDQRRNRKLHSVYVETIEQLRLRASSGSWRVRMASEDGKGRNLFSDPIVDPV